MAKNIILSSLKESFSLIWKSKAWILVLIIVQVGFFAAIFIISNTYLPKVLENAKAMSNYISTQNFDEASMTERVLQQKDILGDEPAAIAKYFDGVIINFRIYLIYLFTFILIFSSLLWSITHKITDMSEIAKAHTLLLKPKASQRFPSMLKNRHNLLFSLAIFDKLNLRQLMRNFNSIFVVLLFYLGLIFLFFYLLLNISFSEAVLQGSKIFIKYIPFLIFSVMLAYFMLVSLALSNKNEIKHLVQKTLTIGIKKAHYILAVYFINILLFILFIFLMSYFIDKNFFIVVLSLILFIFSFIFARIFIVSVVKKLEGM